jgi:transcriptional pleiotropic regulator of transition state genes
VISLLGAVRILEENGRVQLPKDIRRKLGMEGGDQLNIFEDNGRVIIAKYTTENCAYCGRVIKAGETYCDRCKERIDRRVGVNLGGGE